MLANFLTKLKHFRHTQFFADIPKLKKTLKRQYYFVRKNHKQFGSQIQHLIRQQNWSQLRQGLSVISINELDSWLTLRKIAITFQQTLNNQIEVNNMSNFEIQDMFTVMGYLRYEAVQRDKMRQDYFYDNVEPFIGRVKKYIKDIEGFQINKHYMQVFVRLVHTNPAFFQNNKEQIEKYVLKNIDILSKSGYLLAQIALKGLISDFWTSDFKTKLLDLMNKRGYYKLRKALVFQNLQIPNQLTHPERKQTMRTQIQIIHILQGYTYNVKSNIQINQYEVDILLANFLVLEYNGHHHYAINSEKLVPTLKELWKKKILQKRGYVVSSIPYDQWKFIKHFDDKRKYLINKIENDLLASAQGKRSQQL